MATSSEIQAKIAQLDNQIATAKKAYDQAVTADAEVKKEYAALVQASRRSNFKLPEEQAKLENARLAREAFEFRQLRESDARVRDASQTLVALEDQRGQLQSQLFGVQAAEQQQQQRQQTEQKAKADAGAPTNNAGQTVAQAQAAQDDNAAVVNPSGNAQVIKPDGRITDAKPPAVTNAVPPPTAATGDTDTGTNAPARPITETQSTSSQRPNNVGALQTATGTPASDSPTAPAAVSDDRPGVGAANDDQRPASEQNAQTNAVRNRLDELYGGINNAIISQDNVLDNYASYTYSLSWYLMDTAAYQRLINQELKDLNGYYLLVQSAGAGAPTGLTITDEQILGSERQNIQSVPGNSARSPFFPLDYAIDNLEVELLYAAGSESQSAAAFKNLSFTVTEPNGLTLLPNLYRAVEDLVNAGGTIDGKNNAVNYAAALYCMVIRFYGYDENGVLVQPITTERNNTDSRAVVEKFIPFTIKTFDFSVGSKLVEYKIEGATPDIATGLSTNRGSIPQDFEFSGGTVRDLLVGSVVTKQPVASDTSRNGTPQSSAPKYNTDSTTGQEMTGYGSYVEPGSKWPAIKNGVLEFLKFGVGKDDNKLARPKVAEPAPKADTAPKPATVTTGTGLISALNNFQQQLVKKGIYEHADIYDIVFAESIIAQAKTVPPGGLNKNRAGGTPATTAAEKKDPNKSSMSPTVRSRSVRAGTQIVQFIDEVIRNSTYIIDQQSVVYDEKTKQYKKNGKPAENFAWYNISVVAEPGPYDRKRNDYVYRMTFFITPYQVPIVSEYFNPSGFRGVHKVYNYWFTGQNTQVLNFEQKFDQLWTQVLTADTKLAAVGDNKKKQTNSREVWKRHYYAASGENRQGGEGKVFEGGANAADNLYGTNYAEINLDIIGDPAWIPNAQYGFSYIQFTTAPFYPDGTINNSASIPYFEFAWNRPVDYNLETGLMDPGQNNYFADRREGIAGLATEAQTYIAVGTKSIFRGGRFYQELHGKLMYDQTKENAPVDERTAQNPKPVTAVAPGATATPAAQPTPRNNIDGTTGQEMVGYGNYVEPGSAWPKVKEFFKFGVGAGDDKLKGPATTSAQPAPAPATSNGEVVSTPTTRSPLSINPAILRQREQDEQRRAARRQQTESAPPQQIVREP